MFSNPISAAKYLGTLLIAWTFISSHAQTNYALELNGSNQYASIGAPIATNSSYTKEAWVYATSTAASRNIISSANSPFWISGGTLSAGQGGNYTIVTDPNAFTLNRWVHVAVTYNSATTTMRLYRDGNLISTNASAGSYTSENEFIGSHAGAGSYFAGRIDEVRIWNIALTPEQIKNKVYQWPANNQAGLVAYYKCNTGSGTTLTNSTGGTNGTLQNGTTWFSGSPVQFSSNALSFDGIDDVVTIPYHTSLDISTAITLEGWVYATKNSGIQNVMSKSSNTTNTGYIFPRTDNGWTSAVLYLYIAGGWRQITATYPSLNAWHHLAGTYDGTTMRLYVNGVQAASQAQTGTIVTSTNPLTLGNQTGFTEYFGGAADELRIWNIARTQAQIQADMNRELNPSTQTGLVSSYSFYHGVPSGNNAGLLPVFDQKGNNNGTLTNFALAGASSNYVSQNVSLAVLPLRWEYFTVKKQEENVALQWSTSSEQNTREFIIQHSTNSVNWSDIGTVSAAGNSATIKNYQYLHISPFDGSNFYRLQQIDLDGKSSYSEIKSIKLEKTEKLISIVSNTNGVLRFRLTEPSAVGLYSSDGKLIWKKRAGTEILTVDGVPKGVYFLTANGQTKKIILR